MNLFKTKSMHWWELGLIKFVALCFGVAIGANWPDLFGPYKLALLLVGGVVGLCAFYLWLKE